MCPVIRSVNAGQHRGGYRWAEGVPPRWAGARGHHRSARSRPPAQLLGGRGGEPQFRRRARHRPRNPRPRTPRKATAPDGRRYPHRQVPDPADRYGQPPGDRRDRGGPGLHQPLGCSTLARTLATADFRTGHPAPCRGGRDRQTWPRTGDQATAGRTPQRTADRCGHTTGQARPPAEHHTTTARQFRPTDTPTTRHAGPPENTHRQRPTPFGPHRTHSCSVIRNGHEFVSTCRVRSSRIGRPLRPP